MQLLIVLLLLAIIAPFLIPVILAGLGIWGILLFVGVGIACMIMPIIIIYDRLTSKLSAEDRKANTELMKRIKKKHLAETGQVMSLAQNVAAMQLHEDYIDPNGS